MKAFKFLPIVALAALVTLLGCKKDKDPLQDLTLAFDSESFEICENEEIKLSKHLTITPASLDTVTVSWSSSDESVAIAKKNGTVVGVKCGKATVTASSNGKSASCKVVVKEIPITSFTIPSTMRVPDGTKAAIEVTVQPSEASAAHLTWQSSVSDVMPFYDGELGQWCIQTDYIGNVTLTASYESLPSQTCTVTIYDHTKVPVDDFKFSWNTYPKNIINLNSQIKVYAYDITPADANYSEITFSVDNSELATLSKPVYDATNKRYYCWLTTGSKGGNIMVYAKIGDDESTKKSLYFFIEKKDIESVSLPKSDITSFAGGSTYMGESGYTLTPSDAYAENVSFSIKTEDGELVPTSVMEYKKFGSSWYLTVSASAAVGRYSVVATADEVKSEPMYVNVVSDNWVIEQINKQLRSEDKYGLVKDGDGYRVDRYGTIGMRDKFSPRDMFYNYEKLDQSLKTALWMTFEGVTDNTQKAFYFAGDYTKGMDMTDANQNRVEYDYPFQKSTYNDPSTMRKGSFKCTFNLGPVAGVSGMRTFSFNLYVNVTTSYFQMYRIRTDADGNTSRSDLNYEDDCVCVGTEGESYQDAVDLYIEYANGNTASKAVVKSFCFWSTEINYVNGEYHPHQNNEVCNAFAVDLCKRNKNSRLYSAEEGKDLHTTVKFHTAQHATCSYESDPEHPCN